MEVFLRSTVFTEELSDMRKQMKALEEKNMTYMQETMNLEEVCCHSKDDCYSRLNTRNNSGLPMTTILL